MLQRVLQRPSFSNRAAARNPVRSVCLLAAQLAPWAGAGRATVLLESPAGRCPRPRIADRSSAPGGAFLPWRPRFSGPATVADKRPETLEHAGRCHPL